MICLLVIFLFVWAYDYPLGIFFNVLGNNINVSMYFTIYIYIQIVVLPSTGFELTPLIRYSTNRLALCPAP
jgi:hypothetical protein